MSVLSSNRAMRMPFALTLRLQVLQALQVTRLKSLRKLQWVNIDATVPWVGVASTAMSLHRSALLQAAMIKTTTDERLRAAERQVGRMTALYVRMEESATLPMMPNGAAP